MADHSREDVDMLVRLMQQAMRTADLEYRSYREADGANNVLAQQWELASNAA